MFAFVTHVPVILCKKFQRRFYDEAVSLLIRNKCLGALTFLLHFSGCEGEWERKKRKRPGLQRVPLGESIAVVWPAHTWTSSIIEIGSAPPQNSASCRERAANSQTAVDLLTALKHTHTRTRTHTHTVYCMCLKSSKPWHTVQGHWEVSGDTWWGVNASSKLMFNVFFSTSWKATN